MKKLLLVTVLAGFSAAVMASCNPAIILMQSIGQINANRNTIYNANAKPVDYENSFKDPMYLFINGTNSDSSSIAPASTVLQDMWNHQETIRYSYQTYYDALYYVYSRYPSFFSSNTSLEFYDHALQACNVHLNAGSAAVSTDASTYFNNLLQHNNQDQSPTIISAISTTVKQFPWNNGLKWYLLNLINPVSAEYFALQFPGSSIPAYANVALGAYSQQLYLYLGGKTTDANYTAIYNGSNQNAYNILANFVTVAGGNPYVQGFMLAVAHAFAVAAKDVAEVPAAPAGCQIGAYSKTLAAWLGLSAAQTQAIYNGSNQNAYNLLYNSDRAVSAVAASVFAGYCTQCGQGVQIK